MGTRKPLRIGSPHSSCGDPVNCVTGNPTDPDRPVDRWAWRRVELTRAYNSQAAAAGEHGAFGYGWTSSFSDHVVVNETAKTAVVHQADGSTVNFTENRRRYIHRAGVDAGHPERYREARATP